MRRRHASAWRDGRRRGAVQNEELYAQWVEWNWMAHTCLANVRDKHKTPRRGGRGGRQAPPCAGRSGQQSPDPGIIHRAEKTEVSVYDPDREKGNRPYVFSSNAHSISARRTCQEKCLTLRSAESDHMRIRCGVECHL